MQCDLTLFLQTGDRGKILIVSLYVDDLVFTSNDESMFVKFKNFMKLQFEMTDLGKNEIFSRGRDFTNSGRHLY